METVVPVVTAAAAAVANAALDEGVRQMVISLWQKLLDTARRRFGSGHDAPKLLERLGEAGGDAPAADAIARQLEPLRIDADAEVLGVVRELDTALAGAGLGPAAARQTMRDGNGNVQAQGGATVQQSHGNHVQVESVTGAVFSFGTQYIHRPN